MSDPLIELEKEKMRAEARVALLGYYKDELVSHATILLTLGLLTFTPVTASTAFDLPINRIVSLVAAVVSGLLFILGGLYLGQWKSSNSTLMLYLPVKRIEEMIREKEVAKVFGKPSLSIYRAQLENASSDEEKAKIVLKVWEAIGQSGREVLFDQVFSLMEWNNVEFLRKSARRSKRMGIVLLLLGGVLFVVSSLI